jgi:hypothetical protein
MKRTRIYDPFLTSVSLWTATDTAIIIRHVDVLSGLPGSVAGEDNILLR